MELSQALIQFFTNLTESVKLIHKNPKPFFAIATVSLIIPSVIIVLLSYSFRFLLANDPYVDLWAVSTAEVVLIFALFQYSMFISISTILVSATSYTGNTISLQQVFSFSRSTFKMQKKTMSYTSNMLPVTFAIVIGILVNFVVFDPNVTTASITVLIGVPGLIYLIYQSVVPGVAMVVSVVERDCYAKNAVDRAYELVEGQHVIGFLMHIFLNLVTLFAFGGYCLVIAHKVLVSLNLIAELVMSSYWTETGDKAVVNLTIMLAVLVNLLSLFQIFVLVMQAVFYIECKKHRGEKIELVRLDLQYSKLSTVESGNDLP